MISVVICSVNKALAAQVKRNIDNTIGVPFELLLIDNVVEKRSITAVYNTGAAKSKYNIICFVHEDVLFQTLNWGNIIVDLFSSQPETGLIGIAGAKYKSRALSGWTTGIQDFDCCNIIHKDPSGESQRIYLNPEPGTALQKTTNIDGVFMCCRKQVWSETRFNEEILTGFHLYDIDFSMAVSIKHEVAVTYEIDMVHLTKGGDYGDAWVNYTLLWHKNKRHLLPRLTEHRMPDSISGIEKKIKRMWLNRLKGEPILFRNRLKWLAANNAFSDIDLLPHILLFLFYRNAKRLRKH